MRWSLLFLAACRPGIQADERPDPIHLLALSVEPEEATLTTSPDAAASLQLTAWATYDNGDTEPADYVEWSVSNRSAGSVDADGVFTTSQANGGVTWVTAHYAGLDASGTVTVLYQDELVEGGVDPAQFEGTAEILDQDPWRYPEDGVNLPRNTPRIHFQWQDLGASAYRIRFSSAVSDISVYTDENGWEADEERWQVIAGTNAGGEVQVELQAVVEGRLVAAPVHTIVVNRMDARGAIYYWSSSVQGVKRIPYGAEEAENFLSRYETDNACIGCHAISTGADPLIAWSYVPPGSGSSNAEGFLELSSLDGTSSILTTEDDATGNFKTFSPDGERLLVTDSGRLFLYDARTGELLGDVTPPDPERAADYEVPNVDWSPDGSRVAVVLAEWLTWDVRFYNARLAVMDVLEGDRFGEPEILVDPEALMGPGDWNAYYPAWSPDGQWLAFNLSTGDSYDDGDAELWVVSAEGGDPIRLEAANQAAGLTNSWPRWGPLPDDDVLWITFASRRDYGYTMTTGLPQIWAAAFDPRRIQQGLDPSYPAFWLPGQVQDENNHIPVWVD